MKGKRWDSVHDEDLRRMYDSEELGILAIAKTFGRTAGAVANRLKLLKIVRSDLRTEDYPQHIRGWMEYLGDSEFREVEKLVAKPKTSRLLGTTAPADEVAQLRSEMNSRFNGLERMSPADEVAQLRSEMNSRFDELLKLISIRLG